MSKGPKLPFDQVMPIAEGMVERLSPACHRIEIAGSLRRRKPMVGDIEIVAVPRLQADLLGQNTGVSYVDLLLEEWPIQLIKNGEKYKQFVFKSRNGRSFQVDLFLQPDPATWGVNFMIRTGSADFSHKMVTRLRYGGYMPNEFFNVAGARVLKNGWTMETPEEEDVFNLWEMPFVPPPLRV